VTPGALLSEIMSKSGASFIETTSDTRCFIDLEMKHLLLLLISINKAPGVTRGLNK
jgi:hypothetical protein